MASKNKINQLIRDEWNKPTQLNIWDALEGSQNGSCVTSNITTHEPNPKSMHEPAQWVQEYAVTSHGKKHKYYRYCYLEEPGNIGSCVRVHLSGGNIHSAKAIALKEKVELAIAQKLSPAAIVEIIKSNRR